MPPSLEKFAEKYGGKLIFAKEDIKMAAFETNPIKEPGKTSKVTLDFIERVSKDPIVEKAFEDEFMFTDAKKVYRPEPKVVYPEDMKDDYVPNEVIVDFWRMPPSLEEFAKKYNAKVININEYLMSATFKTSNMVEFLRSVSKDPIAAISTYTLNGTRHQQQAVTMHADILHGLRKLPVLQLVLAHFTTWFVRTLEAGNTKRWQ